MTGFFHASISLFYPMQSIRPVQSRDNRQILNSAKSLRTRLRLARRPRILVSRIFLTRSLVSQSLSVRPDFIACFTNFQSGLNQPLFARRRLSFPIISRFGSRIFRALFQVINTVLRSRKRRFSRAYQRLPPELDSSQHTPHKPEATILVQDSTEPYIGCSQKRPVLLNLLYWPVEQYSLTCIASTS